MEVFGAKMDTKFAYYDSLLLFLAPLSFLRSILRIGDAMI
jgi:hypothetical protein